MLVEVPLYLPNQTLHRIAAKAIHDAGSLPAVAVVEVFSLGDSSAFVLAVLGFRNGMSFPKRSAR